MTATATRLRPTHRAPSVLGIGVARVGLELRLFFRERRAFVVTFAYPVIMLGIFASVFGQNGALIGPAPGIPFAQWFLPGMVATGLILLSFENIVDTIAIERDDGTLKRLRGTPMPALSYFLGKIGLVLVTCLLQTAILLAVAAAIFNVSLPSSASAWATFAWVFVLATATGCVCGIGFSAVPPSGRAASAIVNPVVLILQFISGVFFVYGELPTWMQQVAAVFPLKWVAQGMRSVFLPAGAETMEPGGSWQQGEIAVALVVWLVIGLVIGDRTFRWTRHDDV
ncbi:MAG: ABC transporter permease [Candidatus Limnocylindria bacterium]